MSSNREETIKIVEELYSRKQDTHPGNYFANKIETNAKENQVLVRGAEIDPTTNCTVLTLRCCFVLCCCSTFCWKHNYHYPANYSKSVEEYGPTLLLRRLQLIDMKSSSAMLTLI